MQSKYTQEKRETMRNVIATIVLIFSFLGIFIYAIEQASGDFSKREKVKKIKSDEAYLLQGGTFICSSSPLLTSAKYLVSKHNGWEIYNANYFKKEDLLIDFKSCNRTTEQ